MSGPDTSYQVWIDAACAQQDYGWFLAILAAGALGIAWWRAGRNRSEAWLAGGAVASMLHSIAAIAAFLSPFNERIAPEPHALPPNIVSDLVMAGSFGLIGGVWWWRLTEGRRILRWAGWVGLAAICGLRLEYPQAGSVALAVALTGMAPLVIGRVARTWLAVSVLMLVAAAWFSPWGPLAGAMKVLQRGRDWSALSVVCPLLLSGAHLAALVDLLQRFVAPLAVPARRTLVAAMRPFLVGATCWLAGGLMMMIATSRNTRTLFESSALHRVQFAAALFDSAGLDAALGSDFRPVPSGHHVNYSSGQQVPVYFSASTANARIRPAMAQLKRYFDLNPDLTYVCISVPHEDKLFEAIPIHRSEPNSGRAYVLKRLTAEDRERWLRRTPHAEIGTTPSGTMFMARAPLAAPDGRIVGWLQFDQTIAQWAAAQAQARVLTFLIVAMGLGLVSLWFLRQARERERTAAINAATAAKEANRQKTTFLANVSHELRTPIQSILGYAELMQRHVRSEVERTRLSALRQHGELMIRLVNDLIDLGMLESGAFRLVEKTFAPKRLVQEVVESLMPRAEAKGLRLASRVEAAVADWVVSDPERLRQVLLNLVGNAVKYTEKGEVEVVLALRAEGPGVQWVDLMVRDTGPGIGPEEQRVLFEPFSRLANAERHEGAGLGLALTAGLCRRLGDGLSLESDGISGCVFRTTLVLPLATAPVEPIRMPQDVFAGWKILVADDNALVRELFVTYLTELGAECIAVGDGPAAVARAAEPGLRAIVLDLAMPGLDGTEVARRVRANGGTVRIVGVSAHAGGSERAEALAAGMDVFLLKPIELPALATALRPGEGQTPPVDCWTLRRWEWTAAFRDELPGALAGMADALSTRAWDRLRRGAHYLKNSATVVRDDGLFAACGEVESAAERENVAAATQVLSAAPPPPRRWLPEPRDFRPRERPSQPEPSTQS